MEINKTTIRIAGREYSLSGKEPEEYMHRVAIYVDRKIMELEHRYPNFSTNEIAVLAAINVTDELFKLRDELSAMEGAPIGEVAPMPKEQASFSKSAPAKHFFSKPK